MTALLLLSDAHLSEDFGQTAGRDLAVLAQRYRDAELILVGDIFDLSLSPPGTSFVEAANRILHAHPELLAVLKARLAAGQPLTLVPGNHDAELSAPEASLALKHLLEVPSDRPLQITPWFVRRRFSGDRDVHIEHGHLYDPDCAPNHPLASHDPASEGLGTALMRRFIAPHGALDFAHAHTTTPLSGLKKAFDKWGFRAPLVIADYFRTSLTLCAEATWNSPIVERDRQGGEQRLAEHAQRVDLEPALLRELLAAAPVPTHHSLAGTFSRLYFDRIFATVAAAGGAVCLARAGLALPAAGRPLEGALGALLTTLGAGYLSYSLGRHVGRNDWRIPVRRLGEAAGTVNRITGSRLTVFGHTHVEVDEPGYLNLGSFGYSRHRPYALIDQGGRHERNWLGKSSPLSPA